MHRTRRTDNVIAPHAPPAGAGGVLARARRAAVLAAGVLAMLGGVVGARLALHPLAADAMSALVARGEPIAPATSPSLDALSIRVIRAAGGTPAQHAPPREGPGDVASFQLAIITAVVRHHAGARAAPAAGGDADALTYRATAPPRG